MGKNPAAFDNKLVRLRATLAGNFEISALRDPDDKDCDFLWFTYPGSGPEAMVSVSGLLPTQPRPAVRLRNNRQFKRFRKLVDAKMYPRQQRAICEGCNRYEVTADMVGLIEFASPGHGFGHMNGFPVQFVLQSIRQTWVKDIAPNYKAADFSTTPVRFPTGYITGILVSPDGRPVADGDLNVYSATDPSANIDWATTDRRGHFKFAIPPGSYVIGFNTSWPPSAEFPFPPTYYPSTQQQSTAKILVLADKQHISRIVLKLPRRLAARRIPVKVVWPNGKPVADANVWLSEVSDPVTIVGTVVSHTGTDGTFALVGLEGIDYILHADKYAGLGRVSCAKNFLLRAGDSISTLIQLSLTKTAFDVCKNIDFEVPTNNLPQR